MVLCQTFFESNIGVRQGENISPFLFAVFLNDLESFLSSNPELQGVDCVTNAANNMIYMNLKIFVLLYADDTVILAESSDDLQIGLDMYSSYCRICRQWKLEINYDKTKIMVFARGRTANFIFYYKRYTIRSHIRFQISRHTFWSKWFILCSKKVYCKSGYQSNV